SSPPPHHTPLTGLAVDGKTLRGSRTGDDTVHLLAATRHDTQTVAAQQQVKAKSNEIPAFTPLLRSLDLTSTVITADALHTQHAHAQQVIADGGHYLFIVKGNQYTHPAPPAQSPALARSDPQRPHRRDRPRPPRDPPHEDLHRPPRPAL
ncbi:ISAs1 family transposase, partial [Nonomuraea sp. K271]|uniref:ISAs1 family transposase n=1 Tax=Nonomuraea sp. K271 TaxID=1848319 RepID=UPI001378E086